MATWTRPSARTGTAFSLARDLIDAEGEIRSEIATRSPTRSREPKYHKLRIFALALLLWAARFRPLAPSNRSGFSTYGKTPDGQRVRLWTDFATCTKTGTVGGEIVRFNSSGCG